MTRPRAENIRAALDTLDTAMESPIVAMVDDKPMEQLNTDFTRFAAARDKLRGQPAQITAKLAEADARLAGQFAGLHSQLRQHLAHHTRLLRRLRWAGPIRILEWMIAVLVLCALIALGLWFFWPQIVAGYHSLLAAGGAGLELIAPAPDMGAT